VKEEKEKGGEERKKRRGEREKKRKKERDRKKTRDLTLNFKQQHVERDACMYIHNFAMFTAHNHTNICLCTEVCFQCNVHGMSCFAHIVVPLHTPLVVEKL
jgi:hypothetical protein